MALLNILTDENPRLRLKSKKIEKFDKNLRQLAQDMLDTMEDAGGIGLAAPQVGALQRLIVIDIPAELEFEGSQAFRAVVVNPEIIKSSGEEVGEEGCLSVPGWYGDVKRYYAVTVRGRDVSGREVRIKTQALPARCLQHEIDHLDGIIFTDVIVDAASLHKVKPADEEEKTAKANTRELVKVI